MVRINDSVRNIADSITSMRHPKKGERLLQDVLKAPSGSNLTDVVSSLLSIYAGEVRMKRGERMLRQSKLPCEVYFSDFAIIDGRNIDSLKIEELAGLYFISEKKPLVIEGTPGTGKTWLGMAVATKACLEGHKTRWVNFPAFLEELRVAKFASRTDGSDCFSQTLKYYTGFEVLCIDEFLNSELDPTDVFILQELFNLLDAKRKPFVICTQCDLDKIPEMLGNTSIGFSIRGRILGRAKRISIIGPDIRLLPPDKKPKGT